MISLLMTEQEADTLASFLRKHGVNAECCQSHPLCFLLARLYAEPNFSYGAKGDSA